MIPFLPFPHVHGGELADGSLLPAPPECRACPQRECQAARAPGDIGLCRFGFNFVHLSSDLLVNGVVLKGESPRTAANRRVLRRHGATAVPRAQLDAVVAHAAAIERSVDEIVEGRVAAELRERRKSGAIRKQLVTDLEPHIKNAAGQLHDYLDLSGVILKQLNVYLARNYPDIAVPDGLDDAPDELQAVYWAAKLMEEKIAAFGFYLEPQTITARSGSFRLHGAVTKYRKIYQRSYQAKSVSLTLTGESFANVRGNPEALTIIPHALIDNAIKYAPRGSQVVIAFDEGEREVELCVGSFGPVIESVDEQRIFDPFYRGRAAIATGEEGMGFGLAFADRIARSYGKVIEVRQDPASMFGTSYWTEFSCRFDIAADDRRSPRGRRLINSFDRRSR